MLSLKLLVTGFLLCAVQRTTTAHWVGEEYWTIIDYSGGLPAGRSVDDFLQIPNADGTLRSGWVAYWITRSKYPGIHYEAFGGAFRRDDGRICGYFVGDEDEVAEVCGGFRVLSRNRENRFEKPPFEWVLAQQVWNRDNVVGFAGHQVASTSEGGQTVYGDSLLAQKQFKGVVGVKFEPWILKIVGNDQWNSFSSRVYLLTKTTPQRGPTQTGHYENGPYHDPHTKHAHGRNGHPVLREKRIENPHHVYNQVESRDKRLDDPRANPAYSFYDPIFDPRSPLYDPRYNPYDPQYDVEKDREWRLAHGFSGDGYQRPPQPKPIVRLPPREPPREDRQPPKNVPVLRVKSAEIFIPGNHIRPQKNASTLRHSNFDEKDPRRQQVIVEGYLLCEGRPAREVKVKLYEEDRFSKDDLLQQTYTNETGHFRVSGITREDQGERMQPRVYFYHRCKTGGILPCDHRSSEGIPNDFVFVVGETPKVYELPNVELSLLDRSRDCI